MPNGGTAPSPHPSLWSGPATGNTDSLNLGDEEKDFTKSEDLTQRRVSAPTVTQKVGPVTCCRQESVSLLHAARLRYWSLTKLDRTDSPESGQNQ